MKPAILAWKIEKYLLQSLASELLPDERVHSCMRYRVNGLSAVQLRYSEAQKRAWFGNLITCGSVWHCPICASKITQQRKEELEAGIKRHRFYVVLISYTLAHSATDTIANLLSVLKVAHRKMKSGRQYQAFKVEYSVIGSFTATEVTYGVSGWHPHLHEMLICDRSLDVTSRAQMLVFLKKRWSEIIDGEGRYASFTHGLDLQFPEDFREQQAKKAAGYVTKSPWGIEAELTKSIMKKNRSDGTTIIGLLRDYGNGDTYAGDLFVEYARALKGKQFLVASRGIKQILGVGSESDASIANADEIADFDRLLASIDPLVWRKICRQRLRGELLEVAQSGDETKVLEWLKGLS